MDCAGPVTIKSAGMKFQELEKQVVQQLLRTSIVFVNKYIKRMEIVALVVVKPIQTTLSLTI